MLKVGPNAGKYAHILSAELYSALAESKVIEEAALRSGKEVKRVNSSNPGTRVLTYPALKLRLVGRIF